MKDTEELGMQTMYDKTSNFIRHSGNMIDLDEFRRRLELAGQPEMWAERGEERGFQPVVLTLARGERRRARQERRAWTLDTCASLAVVFMTLVFALRVMV